MKKIILLILIFPIYIIAQTEPYDCNFIATPEYHDLSKYTGLSEKISLTDGTTYVINVKFLLISQNGVSAHDVTEQDLLRTIALMNIEFNEWRIFFKYRGFSFLENTDYPFDYVNGIPYNLNDAKADFIDAGIFSEDMFNIMVLYSGNSGGLGSPYISSGAIKSASANRVVIHEVGHSLGLLHIFSGNFEELYLDAVDCYLPLGDRIMKHIEYVDSENITRDILDPNYNASGENSKGDHIHDTPACHYRFRYNVCHEGISGGETYFNYYEDYRVVDASTNNDEECFHCSVSKIEYCYTDGNNFYTETDDFGNISIINLTSETWTDIINSLTSDCNQILEGKMYRDLESLNYNYMSYGWYSNYFTEGQAVRMHETIDTSSILQNTLAKLPNGTSDLSVLYEPYNVEIIETISEDIHSLTDNGDGTAEVCRVKTFALNHYFQPGFDYSFYQGNVTNITHQVDKDDLYGILDEGILRYVKINQINPSCLVNIFDDYTVSYSDIDNGVIFYEPTPCLRPTIVCVTEPYDNGKVLSSTNLANPNPTIKILTNQEVSDPNLEQNLENNKFHIIEKTTTSGAKMQKTIYKDGN